MSELVSGLSQLRVVRRAVGVKGTGLLRRQLHGSVGRDASLSASQPDGALLSSGEHSTSSHSCVMGWQLHHKRQLGGNSPLQRACSAT